MSSPQSIAGSRNLDPRQFYEATAAQHTPALTFDPDHGTAFQAWKQQTLPRVLETLGDTPAAVDPRPELLVEWQEDGLTKQRWAIDVQPHLSAIVLIYRPSDLTEGERRPALLCCHGHGDFGKDTVMGLGINDAQRLEIATQHNHYGLKMAQKGFVTYSLDWIGFGERNAQRKPSFYDGYYGRDICNVNQICATLLGRSVLGSNIHDAKAATDLVCRQPYVDADRLGVIGLSYGGTMSTWMMLADERFLASSVCCYTGPFHAIGYERYDICGSQITNGLFKLVDVADLQGLIAPRPLLLEVALHDRVFQIDPILQQHLPQLQRIYNAADAADRLTVDLFEGDHRWHGQHTDTFFRTHLHADWP